MPALSKTGEQCRVLQRHLSARRRHAAEDGGDDARRARRRAVLPLPRAVDRGRRPRSTAAISCPRRPSSPSPLRWKRSASTARCSWRSRIPRPISNCSGRSRARRPARDRPAAPLRCGCGRTRILPARWKLSAAQRGIFARPNSRRRRQHDRRAFRRWPGRRCRSRPSLRSARAPSRRAPAARWKPQLDIALVDYTRRHRRGPADARRQSGADDDGAGARSVVSAARVVTRTAFPIQLSNREDICRPGERRDPYSLMSVVKNIIDHTAKLRSHGVWVPAQGPDDVDYVGDPSRRLIQRSPSLRANGSRERAPDDRLPRSNPGRVSKGWIASAFAKLR